jgi:hypothetical protein
MNPEEKLPLRSLMYPVYAKVWQVSRTIEGAGFWYEVWQHLIREENRWPPRNKV